MDFIRTSVLGSYLLLKGPLKIKLGLGLSAGKIVAGQQVTNGKSNNIMDSKAYNSIDFGGLGEAGLVLEASEIINVQLTYFYRKGLNNLEANSSSSTKTISNGIQASVLFSF